MHRLARSVMTFTLALATALMAVSTADAQRVTARVRSQADVDGRARVIVQLATPARAAGVTPDPSRLETRRAIRTARGAVLRGLRGLKTRTLRQYESVPYLALEVGPDGLDALEGMGEVLDVQEDALLAPTLVDTIPLIDADQLWTVGQDGSGWQVAVLDTGVDGSHPFFAGKIAAEACFSSSGNCPNGQTTQLGSGAATPCTYSSSECFHGTHVAGIAAGSAADIAGVARGAGVIAIQVFSRVTGSSCGGGPSPCARTFTSDQIAALDWLYMQRVNYQIAAVNMSLGGARYTSQATCDAAFAGQKAAIDNLRAVDIATVIASGNDGYTDALSAPACISSAVSVGCTSKSDGVCSFSNSTSFLSLLAPGLGVISSLPGGAYDAQSGTSMSAPHVAGAWAILRQLSSAASVSDILAALQSSGHTVTDARNGVAKPRIDVRAAATALLCGNHAVDPGEECDDGNVASDDGCDANCTTPRCGNGVTNAGEQCDDGNDVDGDACKGDCTTNVCGDGAVRAGVEACDDGNASSSDGCSAACQVELPGGNDLGGRWVGRGPLGGASVPIVYDPQNPSIVYAGTGVADSYGAGVFKSTDAGHTWTSSSEGMTSFNVDALAIFPQDTAILYAGTGQGEVFRSDDGAVTWSKVASLPVANSITGLAVDPTSASTLYAASFGQGVYKTTDAGQTWLFRGSGLPLGTGGGTELAIDPSNPATLYASVFQGGFFKSTDGGASWAAAGNGLGTTALGAIRIDPVTPTTIYLASQAGVFKSVDGAASWVAQNAGLTQLVIRSIAISTSNPGTIYVGTQTSGVFRSADGAGSWLHTRGGLPEGSTITGLAADPSNPSRAIAAPFLSGPYSTTNGGISWATSGSGLNGGAMNAVAIAPSDPTQLYAVGFASIDASAGAYRSHDGGASWVLANTGLPAVPMLAVAIDPTAAQTAYVGVSSGNVYAGVYKTIDGGTSWSPANGGLGTPGVYALAVHSAAPTTLYAGTTSGVYVSTDAAGSWSARSVGLPAGATVLSLAIDPSAPAVLYAGLQDGGVYRSNDSGSTWTFAGTGLETYRAMQSIAIDPVTSSTLYVGTQGGGLYKSTDAGASWAFSDAGIVGNAFDVRAVAIDPQNPTRVYRGSSGAGVHHSADGGVSWAAFNDGLNTRSVRALVVDPAAGRRIYAASYGGGVFRRETVCGDGVVDSPEGCDGGVPGGDACCSATCQPRNEGGSCTDDGSTCTADVCSGGACAHPAGNAGAVCRAAAGSCDVAEACSGTSTTCPADVRQPSGTQCRGAAGGCDVAEVCDGSGAACPSDVLRGAGSVCRVALGDCDVAETCSGSSATCPSDVLRPTGTVCRAAAGLCDQAEACDGSMPACPSDGFSAAGTACRVAAGACDVAETCTGASAACPADAMRPSGSECRAAAGPCDVAEACDGAGTTCPSDALRPTSFECRPSTGQCDPAEHCSGSAACPGDAFASSGTACMDDGDACTIDACDGAGACVHGAAGDGDGDGRCDATDPCTNVADGRTFVTPPKSKLVLVKINNDPTTGNDGLSIAASFRLPATSTFADVNPVQHGARVVVESATGVPRLDVTVPAGAYSPLARVGWKRAASGKSWTFLDQSASPAGGIRKVTVTDKNSAAAPGLVKIVVTGKKGVYPVLGSDSPVQTILSLGSQVDAAAGLCGESAYVSTDCVFNARQDQLVCKR